MALWNCGGNNMAEGEPKNKFNWVDLAKVVALPLVTLIVGALFNPPEHAAGARQQVPSTPI
jgi:hypothetical protein